MFENSITRRQLLQQSACGFGAVAANAMLARTGMASSTSGILGAHHVPRAKRIIFLFMYGGVSQVDSFDYKPLLAQRHGELLTFGDARQLAKTGKPTEQKLLNTPWKFNQYGQSGRWVSDLFPGMAEHVDDLCLLHGMHTEGVAHGPATLFLHCGSTNMTRPSMGSWVNYGLGSENENLPGFVSISPLGPGGPRKYGAAFLPPKFQGTRLVSTTSDRFTIDSLTRDNMPISEVARQIELLQRLNRQQLVRRARHDAELEAALESHELAWRMQQLAPDVLDLSTETASTQKMYGIDDAKTKDFGQKCLLARRLCESGVRFIEVNYGGDSGNWDQHSDLLRDHSQNAKEVDKPIAGLIADLKARGLLKDTLVVWGGEFGRTPTAQGSDGRDHNPEAFTYFLAGGGVKAGLQYGSTDDYGYYSVVDKVHFHDLHATILHLLGMDHKRLTYRYAGRDFRLTDVHGELVNGIIA